MFGSRYFNARHFNARYWTATGGASVVVTTRRYAIKAPHWRRALMLVIEE